MPRFVVERFGWPRRGYWLFDPPFCGGAAGSWVAGAGVAGAVAFGATGFGAGVVSFGAAGAVEEAGGVVCAVEGAGVAAAPGDVFTTGASGSTAGAGAGEAGAVVAGAFAPLGAASGSIGFEFSCWMRFSSELAFFCAFEFTAVIVTLVAKKTAAKIMVVRTRALAAPRPEIIPPVPPPPMPSAPPSDRWSITAITSARHAIR